MSVRRIKAGSADQSVIIRIVDSTDGTPETGVVFNTSGIDLWYRREGAASVDIAEATLSALTDAHSDGGFLHINDGWYRLDLPDAAVADGVTGVQIGGTVTGMVVLAPYIELVDYDPYDGVRLGLTALPNAAADAAGGLPISDAGGLDLDGMNNQINTIEGQTDDIGAAGAGLTAVPWNAAWDAEVQSEVEDAIDDAFVIRRGLAQDGDNFTITLDAGASATDDFYNGQLVVLNPGTDAQARIIVDYDGTSKVASIVVAFNTAPQANDNFVILAASRVNVDAWKSEAVSSMVSGRIEADMTSVSGSAPAAVNLEADYDGTGYNKTNSAIGTATTIGATGLAAIWDRLTSALTTAGSIGKLLADNINAAISSRSSHSASDVTGGTTVAQAESNIRGADSDTLETLSDQADLLASAAALATVDTVVDAIKAKTDNLPGNFPKNVALPNFAIVMRDTSGDPATGLTVSATISKDGAAFGALTNAITEIGNGAYKVDITQAEMNADVIILRFTATGADDLLLMLKTDA